MCCRGDGFCSLSPLRRVGAGEKWERREAGAEGGKEGGGEEDEEVGKRWEKKGGNKEHKKERW